MSAVVLSGVLITAAPLPASAAVAAPAHQAGAARLPTPIAAAAARDALEALTVAAPRAMTGYSRAKFPHWMSQSRKGAGCDTREVVLARDGQGVERDSECRAVSGVWKSLYDGRRYTRAASVDIDHVVPLANAWRSGADAWSTQRRRAFANDLTRPQLIAVSAASNRSKGDQSPDQWQPPLGTSWCLYSRAWVQVKQHYSLTVTAAEKTTLRQMLNTCPAPVAGTARAR
ncbi:HNH endonuclease family protein [Streptosporangium sp. NPDC048047]|uniref:HNH endonuclease family protein n=1 Tax=Streptosporangium sp. NPDC048047 TaxID=3155748 RepID=UPI00341B382A